MPPVPAQHRGGQPAEVPPEDSLLASALGMLDIQGAEGAKGLDFGPTMFRNSSSKAREVVWYHLYTVVEGKAQAKKFFKGVYPSMESKQQALFYQRVAEWLKELRAARLVDEPPSLSHIKAAVLNPRAISFMLELAYVGLQKAQQRAAADDTSSQPAVTGLVEELDVMRDLPGPLLGIAQAQVQQQAGRHVRLLRAGAALAQRGEEAAAQLKGQYIQLLAQRDRLLQQEAAELAAEATAAAAAAGSGSAGGGVGGGAMSMEDVAQEVAAATAHMTEQLEPPKLQVGACGASGGGSISLEAAAGQSAAQLWAHLEAHLGRFKEVGLLVEKVVACEVHPNAIDGAKLRAAAGLVGSDVADAAATGVWAGQVALDQLQQQQQPEVDIVALLEGWISNLQLLAGPLQQLAGMQQQQQHGAPTPLLASGDAASHAPHLFAQQEQHGKTLEGMQRLRAALAAAQAAADARVEGLLAQVDVAMEEYERCGQNLMAAAAAQQQQQQQGAGEPATPAGKSGAGGAKQAAVSLGSLLAPGLLPLVPPTPMLLQQVANKPAVQAVSKAPRQADNQQGGRRQQQQKEQQQPRTAAEQPAASHPQPQPHSSGVSIGSCAVDGDLPLVMQPAGASDAAAAAAAGGQAPSSPALAFSVHPSRRGSADGEAEAPRSATPPFPGQGLQPAAAAPAAQPPASTTEQGAAAVAAVAEEEACSSWSAPTPPLDLLRMSLDAGRRRGTTPSIRTGGG